MKDYQIRSKTYAKAQNDMNSTLVEYVNGIEVIKAFNQSTASYEKFSNAIDFFLQQYLELVEAKLVLVCVYSRAVTPSTCSVLYRSGAIYI